MSKTAILIVEDEAIVAADLGAKLRQLGYEIAGIAAGGEEAVAMACRLRPHLVLMDIRLEGSMDGIEAAEAISRQHDAPVIYLTAHSDAATLARAKLTGPFGYILKPFQERELATQIELALYKHQADRQLREAAKKYSTLFNATSDGVWIHDLKGEILEVNDAYCRMSGYSRDELIHMPIGKLDVVETPDEFAKRIKKVTETSGHDRFESRHRRKDGTIFDVDLTALHFQKDDGRIAIFVRDITERKRMENELRKSRDELELRVQERTAELETYMKKLQDSNQALQDFASIASHDMQEPLRKVISFGNMLRQRHGDSLGNEGKDYLDRMLNATVRMQALLKSLLDYSRVTTRAEPFRKVDLAAVAGEVLSDLEVRIQRTGAEVHVSGLPTVEADPIQMRQLFQNLIGNALKFQREGEKPFIEVRGTSLDNGITEMVVADNGIGFDDKYQDRIFVPFQRLLGRSAYEGTGMGLAICKKIVDRHNGTIRARGIPGRGAVFTVTLPSKQKIPNKANPDGPIDQRN
jgi:PAS domain S-box-containing protein